MNFFLSSFRFRGNDGLKQVPFNPERDLQGNEVKVMSRLGRIIFFAIQLVILGSTAGICYAEMYKWVDADGQTHYSEKPPAGDIEVSTIKPPPKVDTEKALKELEERKNRLKDIEENRNEKAEEQSAAQEEQAGNQANCDLARDKLSRVINNPRVYSKDEDGNRYKIAEEERQAKIAEARKLISEYCK